MKKKPYQIQLNPKRDHQVLHYLWKWKVATAASLALKFFGSSNSQAAYRRLMKMKKANFITTQCIDHDGLSHVWTLTKKGFEMVAANLPPLKERGFKSECLAHDLITAAFHQGPWLKNVPENTKMITEQQLRRFDEDFLEIENGLISSLHRPDGITQIRKDWFAFEVELSMKRNSDYELTGEYYEGRGYKKVFWLVQRKSHTERIRKHLNASNDFENCQLHEFFLYEDFVSLGWNAPNICTGGKGPSTLTMLIQECDNGSSGLYNPCYLDVRKFPNDLASCRILRISQMSD